MRYKLEIPSDLAAEVMKQKFIEIPPSTEILEITLKTARGFQEAIAAMLATPRYIAVCNSRLTNEEQVVLIGLVSGIAPTVEWRNNNLAALNEQELESFATAIKPTTIKLVLQDNGLCQKQSLLIDIMYKFPKHILAMSIRETDFHLLNANTIIIPLLNNLAHLEELELNARDLHLLGQDTLGYVLSACSKRYSLSFNAINVNTETLPIWIHAFSKLNGIKFLSLNGSVFESAARVKALFAALPQTLTDLRINGAGFLSLPLAEIQQLNGSLKQLERVYLRRRELKSVTPEIGKVLREIFPQAKIKIDSFDMEPAFRNKNPLLEPNYRINRGLPSLVPLLANLSAYAAIEKLDTFNPLLTREATTKISCYGNKLLFAQELARKKAEEQARIEAEKGSVMQAVTSF